MQLVAASLLLQLVAATPRQFDITDFGAKPDGTTLATEGSLGIRSNGSDGLTQFTRTREGLETLSERTTDNDGDGINGDIALVFWVCAPRARRTSMPAAQRI